MPRKFVYAFSLILVAAALAACNNGGVSTVVATPTPLPTGTTATVTAEYQGNLLVNQPINLYNTNGNTKNPQPSGAPIATQNTDTNGQTTFTGLTSAGYYCFQYQYAVNGSTTVTATYCGDAWAPGVILGS